MEYKDSAMKPESGQVQTEKAGNLLSPNDSSAGGELQQNPANSDSKGRRISIFDRPVGRREFIAGTVVGAAGIGAIGVGLKGEEAVEAVGDVIRGEHKVTVPNVSGGAGPTSTPESIPSATPSEEPTKKPESTATKEPISTATEKPELTLEEKLGVPYKIGSANRYEDEDMQVFLVLSEDRVKGGTVNFSTLKGNPQTREAIPLADWVVANDDPRGIEQLLNFGKKIVYERWRREGEPSIRENVTLEEFLEARREGKDIGDQVIAEKKPIVFGLLGEDKNVYPQLEIHQGQYFAKKEDDRSLVLSMRQFDVDQEVSGPSHTLEDAVGAIGYFYIEGFPKQPYTLTPSDLDRLVTPVRAFIAENFPDDTLELIPSQSS